MRPPADDDNDDDPYPALVDALRAAIRQAVKEAVAEAVAEVMPQVLTQANTDPPVLMMDVREAAIRLGLSESKVHRLIAAGEITSVTMGRRRKVPVEAIDTYVQRLSGEQRRLPGM
jgi:excisionase family DNA binding protein